MSRRRQEGRLSLSMKTEPHEAQTTSAFSERNRGNLGEVFVSQKCFRNTGCLIECFTKIVRHSGLVLSESFLSHEVTRVLRWFACA